MAFAFNFEDEEQNQDQGQAPQKLGPESTVITGEEGKPGAAPEQGSGQYTNLQSYLNQSGNQQFGQEFANKVGEGVTQAEQTQSQTADQFKKAADQSTVTRNDQLINEAASTPESIVGDQAKKNQFLQMRDAQYKGPSALTDTSTGVDFYTPTYNATKEAKRKADLATTESGQKALLGEMYGRPDYSKGQQTLDSMLLGMNPGTRESLLAQQQRAGQVYDQFGNLTNQLNEYASKAKGTTEATKNAVTSALSSAIPKYEGQVRSKAEQAIKERDEKVRRINQAIAARDISSVSDAELQSAGLRNNQALYGATAQAVNPNTNLSLDTLTSPEEYKRLLAYQELSPGYVNPITNANLVGSQIGKSLYNPNEALQQQAVDNAKAYNKLIEDTYYAPNGAQWIPQAAAQARGPGAAYNINDPVLMQILQNNMDAYVEPRSRAGVYQQIQDVLNKKRELEAKKDYIKR